CAGSIQMDGTGLQITIFAFVARPAERSRAKCRNKKERNQRTPQHAFDNNKNARIIVVKLLSCSPYDGALALVSSRAGTPSSPLAKPVLNVSNLLFDGCNSFRLNRGVVAKPGQPLYLRFATKPGDLAFRIITMRLL